MEDENKQEAGSGEVEKTEISRQFPESVYTNRTVTIRQGGARSVRGQDVSIRQGGAMSVNGDHVEVTQGVVGLLRSNEATLGPGSRSGAVLADTVSLDQGAAQFVLARDTATMDQSMAVVVAGGHVTARNSAALMVFATSVEGDMKVAFDRQASITFGAAFGAAFGIIVAVLTMLRRRR